MPRFYLPAADWGETANLPGEEARHLSQVMRIKVGGTVTIFDGEGRYAQAQILQAARDKVTVMLGECAISPMPKPETTLVQAVPKGKNMEFIVQKAVELGVSRIQPLITANTIVQPGEGKVEKWRRAALEACKQCGQNILPSIAEPVLWENWLATQLDSTTQPACCVKIMASLAPGALSLRETLQKYPVAQRAIVLIGPEGDFTQTETQQALAAAFLPVTLGKIILRVETAAFFTLAALRYEFDR